MISNHQPAHDAPVVIARVESQERDAYLVRFLDYSSHDLTIARVSGSFRHAAHDAVAFPVVGDYVAVRHDPDGACVIRNVESRRNVFTRRAAGSAGGVQPIAANIDTLLIAVALHDDINIRRIERYLTAARGCGIAAAVVLTKADLVANTFEAVVAIAELDPDLPVVAVSAETGAGLAHLDAFRGPDRTLAIVGPSGAGKSTLVNALAGERLLDTGHVRADDGRGRHTTTRRMLVHLADGTAIVDTPGMREFGLIAGAAVSDAFSDVADLAAQCRFRDCRHQTEPGCAVTADLDADRLESFRKLEREEAFEASKIDAAARRERNRQWKALTTAGRQKARAKRD